VCRDADDDGVLATAVSEALESFGREIDHGRRSHVYSREIA